MPENLPMACSLDGADLRRRYEDLARFGAANLIRRSSGRDGEELRFRRSPENDDRLRSIVAAESECCPFLELELTEDGGELVLRIGGPADTLPIAAGLAAAFERPRLPDGRAGHL